MDATVSNGGKSPDDQALEIVFMYLTMLVWLDSFRSVANAETYVIHLVMLRHFCLVVQRCAIASGLVDIIHVT